MLFLPFRRTLSLRLQLFLLLSLAAPTSLHALTLYGLSTANELLSFTDTTPGTVTTIPITGLQFGDTNLVGIDFRPADGLLYGITAARCYRIDPATGVATTIFDFPSTLGGAQFGVDFNPVADRLRVVSDTKKNYRINLDAHTLIVDPDLNGSGSFDITGNAYSNNVAGATATTLYALDSVQDFLYIQNPPNNGTLVMVGALGVDFTGSAGFDVAQTGQAFAALTVGGTTGLYSINLATGAATLLGAIGSGVAPLAGLSVAPPGVLGLSAPVYSRLESAGTFTITVRRTGGAFGTVSALCNLVADGSLSGLDITAASSTLLTFAPGVTQLTVNGTILNDNLPEDIETAGVQLATPTGDAVLGRASARLIIADDEIPPRYAYVLSSTNTLSLFRTDQPDLLLMTKPVATGLQPGDSLRGIDLRPSNQQLYGLTAQRLYGIQPALGKASLISTLGWPVSGTQFGVDFNPVTDRIRLVSTSGADVRIIPSTGVITTDTQLAYADLDPNFGQPPTITATAYSNNFAGAGFTEIYTLDSNLGILCKQNPPNIGTQNTIGSLGISFGAENGFDISPDGTAFAALFTTGDAGSIFYRINLTTGAAEPLGPIGINAVARGLALAGRAVPRNAAAEWSLYD